MNAIAGIVGSGSTDEVRHMLARMAHRGSHSHTWSPAPDVYFGHIAHRPVLPAEPRLLTTSRDAPLPPASLWTDPAAWLRTLNDDFALAVSHSEGAAGVLLAVDQMAYRSLYVMRLGERWAFASEYKALLALADCPAAVDRDVLQYYLRHGKVDIATTLLAGAKRLVRGEYLLLRNGQASCRTYYDDTAMRAVGRQPRSGREVRERLESILSRQLDGHSRIAVTLSGGLDSTALIALIRRVRPDIAIATYTIGYGADDPEITGARRSAEHFKTEHEEIFFDNGALPNLIPQYVWLTEDLGGRGEAILQQQVARHILRKDKVIIGGHGADVMFGGMPRHRLLWMADRLPPPLRGALRQFFVYTQLRHVPRSWIARKLLQFDQGEKPAHGVEVLGARQPQWPKELTSLRGYRSAYWVSTTFRYHEPAVNGNGLTMYSPFADPQLRELALGLPDSSLVDARRQKRILREALVGVMPQELLRRPKAIQKLRQDEALPAALRQLARNLQIDRSLAARGLIAPGSAERILEGSQRRFTKAAMNDTWGLICAELWMRCFCDGRGEAAVDPAGLGANGN